jgi:galactofuranose transport system substrate-binding protein
VIIWKPITLLTFFSLFSAQLTFSKPLTIGFSQIGSESSWRTAMSRSMKREARKRGITLLFADAQQSQKNQIKAIRSFINKRVDGILLSPVVENGWDNVLKEAKAAKIPVVLVDRGIHTNDYSLYVTKVGADYISEGRMAAAWLADATKGVANIVEIKGPTGNGPAVDRNQGFMAGIAAFSKLHVIRSETGAWTIDSGKKIMEIILASEKRKIDALFIHNDDMAIGAIQVIKKMGLKPGKDILIVSVDGTRNAFDAIRAGLLNATIELNPFLGPPAFDAIEKAIRGEQLPKWQIEYGNVYTINNISFTYPQRGY